MDKITERIPDFCRAEYDEIANFNFSNAFKLDMPVAEVNKVKGHSLQPTFPSEGIEYAYDNWKPKKDDVLIASFPRTGIVHIATHWYQAKTKKTANYDCKFFSDSLWLY